MKYTKEQNARLGYKSVEQVELIKMDEADIKRRFDLLMNPPERKYTLGEDLDEYKTLCSGNRRGFNEEEIHHCYTLGQRISMPNRARDEL